MHNNGSIDTRVKRRIAKYIKKVKLKSKLHNKTFIFKIGNYKAFGGAETQSLILARHLKSEYDARIIFIADN
jgi:hypothetical protein